MLSKILPGGAAEQAGKLGEGEQSFQDVTSTFSQLLLKA